MAVARLSGQTGDNAERAGEGRGKTMNKGGTAKERKNPCCPKKGHLRGIHFGQDFHSRRKHGPRAAEDESRLLPCGTERKGKPVLRDPCRVTLPFTLYLSPRLPLFLYFVMPIRGVCLYAAAALKAKGVCAASLR